MTLRRVLIGVVLLAAFGGVVLFILDQTIFASVAVSTGTPVAPTLAAPTPASTQTPVEQSSSSAQQNTNTSAAATRLYRIDATQSEARYEVGETFFNQNNRFATAIGRTKGIAGDILIDFAKPSSSQIGKVVIDVSQFTSDESRRDNYIRRNALESSRYPQATFVTREIQGLPDQVTVGDQVSFTISGELTVKETTRPVKWNMTLKLESDRVVGSASTEIKMSDFGVGPIQIPLLQTEDTMKLHFDFVALPAEA